MVLVHSSTVIFFHIRSHNKLKCGFPVYVTYVLFMASFLLQIVFKIDIGYKILFNSNLNFPAVIEMCLLKQHFIQ